MDNLVSPGAVYIVAFGVMFAMFGVMFAAIWTLLRISKSAFPQA